MRVLVDTHAFFWWLLDDPKLSRRAYATMAEPENEILISAVVAWELATKVRSGKWPEASEIAANLASYVDLSRFTPYPITLEDARIAGFLPSHHRDPFDRMLAAQSQRGVIPLVSADPVFRAFGTSIIW